MATRRLLTLDGTVAAEFSRGAAVSRAPYHKRTKNKKRVGVRLRGTLGDIQTLSIRSLLKESQK